MLYDFLHNTLGVCLWLILSFAVGAVMAIMGITHTYRQRKREEKFTEQMKERYPQNITT